MNYFIFCVLGALTNHQSSFHGHHSMPSSCLDVEMTQKHTYFMSSTSPMSPKGYATCSQETHTSPQDKLLQNYCSGLLLSIF